MDKQNKKEMINAYKDRKQTGGVYVIKNTVSNKILLLSTADLNGANNRFQFTKETGTCIHIKLKDDWEKLGSAIFEMEVLDKLEKGEAQTPKEFKADLDALLEIWQEKLAGKEQY